MDQYMAYQAKLISLCASRMGVTPDEFAMKSEFIDVAAHWRSFWDSLPSQATIKDITCPGADYICAWWDDISNSTHIEMF